MEITNPIISFIESNLLKISYSILVLIGVRIVLIFVKPSVRKIDQQLKEVNLSESTHKLIENAIRYLTYATAIVIILYIFGVTDVLYAFLTGGAILGFAIGYASRDILSNMLSGVLIALDRPFKIGDEVKILNIEGKVTNIALRTTELKSSEGVIVLIPNSKVLSGAIYNYGGKKKIETK